MTAHELARQLLAGEDLMVTVRGYEGGVNEIGTVHEDRPIHLNVNDNRWYYGNHEYHDDDLCAVCGIEEVLTTGRAIHIGA